MSMTISIAKPGFKLRTLGRVFSGLPVIAAGLCLLGALVLLPHAIESVNWLLIEDDPAALADRKLATAFDSNVAAREIESALAAKDADLAKSFVELARDRQVPVTPDLAARVEIAASLAPHLETCSSSATSATLCAKARGSRRGRRRTV
jgi:hypothetical protein